MELPFLVVHGAVVWKVLLPLLVVLVLASRWGWRLRRARRRAREDLALRGLVTGKLQPGLVTVRGKVVKGSAAALVQRGRPIAATLQWRGARSGSRELPPS